jgi:predicted nucleic acid-binding protein
MRDGPVVANNTPLVALSTLDRLGLLRDLFGEVLIPEAVRDEFLAIDRASREAMLAAVSPGISMVAVQDRRRALAYFGLDRGESEVLALAEERNARLVLIDEWKGRQYAKRLGFPLTGTVGVLLLAKEQGLVTSIAELLADLENNGFRLGAALVSGALETAGE